MDLSIIIPLFNEEHNVIPLAGEIISKLQALPQSYEIIFVNDCSCDQTEMVLKNVEQTYPDKVRFFSHDKNQGQGRAVYTGVRIAKGDCVAILDGDRQFDPQDIQILYHKLIRGRYDIILGKRKNRKGSTINILSSWVGNKLISFVFRSNITDLGCALKVGYRKQILAIVPFRNYHRYLSLLVVAKGARYCEVAVEHRARVWGKSKYSVFKFIGVIMEIFG